MNIFDVQVIQVEENEQPIIVQTSDYYAPVQSVNGKIGFVTINKSDVGLSNVENISITGVSGNLQYQIDNLDTNYASQSELNILSGNLVNTGTNLQSQINNLYNSGFITGVDLSPYYLNSNPSGFITGIDLSNYVTKTNGQFSNRPTVNGTGILLSGEATNGNVDLSFTVQITGNQNISGAKNFYTRPTVNGTGVLLNGEADSNAYPNSNPSGFITGVDTSSLYPRSNPSGFITGVDLSSYATNANLASTGSALQANINSLSGVSVLTYGNQTIDGIKTFRNAVYIGNLYVTGTETVVNTQNFNVQSPYILLNLTGGAVDGGIFFVTGSGLTGINDYGPIIGFDHSNKFKFGVARRSDDLSILNDIAAVQDITNYSGFVNNKYYTKDNPSGFITGIDLSNYYTNNNLSGYITNQNVVFTTGNQTISGIKTFTTGFDIVNGTNPQNLRIFNTTGTSPASGEFGQIGWSGNTFVIGAFNTNSGIARNLELHSAIGRRIILASNGQVGIGTSVGDQTQHGIWVNPPAGQTSITHGNGQVFVNNGSVMFNSNTRVFNNNAFTFGINQNNTTPMIRGINVGSGFTSIQARLADNSNFVNFEANKLIANSGADIYFSGTVGTGVSGSHVGVLVSGLWNNTGQIYTGIQYNITLGSGIAPSITNSLLNVSVNNTGVFNINGRGDISIRRASANTEFTNIVEVLRGTTSVVRIRDDGDVQANSFAVTAGGIVMANTDGVAVRSTSRFGFSSDPTTAAMGTDADLRRDAADTIAQRRGTNAQQFRVYNLTGTNSGEFGLFGWQQTGATGTPNALVIGTQATQSGTLRDVVITGANISVYPQPWVTGTAQYNAFDINITPTNHDYRSTLFRINNTQGSPIFGVQGAFGYTLNQKVRIFGDQRGIVFGPRQTSAIAGSDFVSMRWQTSQLQLLHGTEIGWSQAPFDIGPDLTIFRDAADTLAQRRGLNPQQLRIYNLTGTNSGEFGLFGWQNNNLIIGTQQTQSGALRNLTLTGQNINLSASGVIIPNPTVPTSTGSAGVRGQISWDNDFIYVCVSGDSWKRAALTTW